MLIKDNIFGDEHFSWRRETFFYLWWDGKWMHSWDRKSNLYLL